MMQAPAERFCTSGSLRSTIANSSRHHPTVVAEARARFSNIQLRIADAITAFAGSLKADHDYLHSERELTENTELTRTIAALTAQIKTLTDEIHGQVIPREAADGSPKE